MAKIAVNTLKSCDCELGLKQKALSEIASGLSEVDFESNPARNSNFMYEIITQYTGIKDPFYQHKRESNRQARAIFPDLKKKIENSKQRLKDAIRIAIAGNSIDLGVNLDTDSSLSPESVLEEVEELIFGKNDYRLFIEKLSKAKSILYMSDNAGEIVFDRILVEELSAMGKEVVLSVKSGPIINDANMEDALEAGFGKDIKIVETGNSNLDSGTEYFSEEFLEIFKSTDMIICKGQAHFESLSTYAGPLFFLLKCKCDVIANELDSEISTMVVHKSDFYKENYER